MPATGTRIIDLSGDAPERLVQAARLLIEGFSDTGTGAWRTEDAALFEVHESLQGDRVSRAAIDESGNVLGWIGGISSYDGHAWELHPLVVRRDQRRRGVGRALVADLEDQVRRRDGLTIYLGADDENGRTSLTGLDLYPDVLGALAGLRNLRDHPFTFYQRMGFAIVGVIPDANGLGKPDILMAKRVAAGAPRSRPGDGSGS